MNNFKYYFLNKCGKCIYNQRCAHKGNNNSLMSPYPSNKELNCTLTPTTRDSLYNWVQYISNPINKISVNQILYSEFGTTWSKTPFVKYYFGCLTLKYLLIINHI